VSAAASPSPSARLFVAFLAARAAFGAAFLASALGRWAVPWFLPFEGRFVVSAARPAAELAMDWYGRTAFALAVAIALGAASYALAARGPLARALARPSFVRSLAHAGALVLFVDFAYFGWTMLHQTPAPLPIPAWYCPR
jgi:hypothetical protein